MCLNKILNRISSYVNSHIVEGAAMIGTMAVMCYCLSGGLTLLFLKHGRVKCLSHS